LHHRGFQTILAGGNDPLGTVSGGLLKIRGLLARFTSFADDVFTKTCGELVNVENPGGRRHRRGACLNVGSQQEVVAAAESHGFWILPIWVEEQFQCRWRYFGLVLREPVGDGEEQQTYALPNVALSDFHRQAWP
jgi:hypothetical protein